jgi:hypothetical protein
MKTLVHAFGRSCASIASAFHARYAHIARLQRGRNRQGAQAGAAVLRLQPGAPITGHVPRHISRAARPDILNYSRSVASGGGLPGAVMGCPAPSTSSPVGEPPIGPAAPGIGNGVASVLASASGASGWPVFGSEAVGSCRVGIGDTPCEDLAHRHNEARPVPAVANTTDRAQRTTPGLP